MGRFLARRSNAVNTGSRGTQLTARRSFPSCSVRTLVETSWLSPCVGGSFSARWGPGSDAPRSTGPEYAPCGNRRVPRDIDEVENFIVESRGGASPVGGRWLIRCFRSRAAGRLPWARFLPPLSEPGVPISGTLCCRTHKVPYVVISIMWRTRRNLPSELETAAKFAT